ncbi:MAG TPA: hypothetical protein VE685_08485 [Thermoanaerobaculia bacterium]|nr:hypothetical protein [Thermoanaerobaculia bacterium]
MSDRAARSHPRGRARGGQGRSRPLSSLLLLLLALLAAPVAALDTVYRVRHAE